MHTCKKKNSEHTLTPSLLGMHVNSVDLAKMNEVKYGYCYSETQGLT